MIRRMQRGNHFANIIVDTEPEDKNPFCSTCAAVGKLSRLRERIYLDDKGKLLPPPPNNDFLQCWNCGLVIPLREAQLVGKIAGVQGVEPIENPNDIKKSILGVDSKYRYQRLQKRKNRHEDKEVQAELDKGNLVLRTIRLQCLLN